jgi:sarcosine oxidase subunit delta
MKAWHDYIFVFDNPKGPHREFWQHVLGCRQWLVLERDTSTNTVGASRLAREATAGK